MMRPSLPAALCLGSLLGSGLAFAQTSRPPRPPLPPTETSCFTCHSQLDDVLLEPTQHAKDDIHFSKGLSCHDCHGGDPTAGADGDPEAAHDVAHGFLGKPARTDIPEFCARCHANANYMKWFDPHARVDQLSEYLTSRHGRRLKEEGDTRVAVCIDCHGAHGILAVADTRSPVYPTSVAETCARCHSDAARMESYGIPTGQHEEYRRSVHARALYDRGDISAPTCNDCHGSHGAVPPGVGSIANVCGYCHGREAALIREAAAKAKLDLGDFMQCIGCHGNHAVVPPDDEMLGVGPRSTCIECHSEGDPEYDTAAQMGESVARLSARLREAQELLDRAERAGVEVGPDQFALQEARDQLIETRALTHSFDLDRFLETAGEGITAANKGVEAGRRAFAELRYRRSGLGLSLIIIVAVIIALTMTIRSIEKGSSG
jgi:hypothetical protein